MNGASPADDKPSAGEPGSAPLNVTRLRRAVPVRMWGGRGAGMPCDFCRVLVGPQDVEYEVEARLDDSTVMLHFHPRCHDAWTDGQDPFISGQSSLLAGDQAQPSPVL